jgi:hypothetical protein
MSAHRTFQGSRIFAGGLLLTGLFLVEGAARVSAFPPATSATSPKKTVVTQLRATRTLLQQADHDYQGHRAKAVHEITLAIHALVPPKKTRPRPAGIKPAPGIARPDRNNESQAVSDTQLKQAMQQLNTLQPQITSLTSGNVTAASAAVTKAIQELQTALQIK